MNPSDSIALHNLAALELFRGHPERVLARELAAMRVSPRDPKMQQMLGIVALAELHQGHHEQALEWAERAVAIDREYIGGQGYVAAAAALLGDRARAQAALAELTRLRPEYRIATFRDEFTRYSAVPAFVAGQERYYEGLRRAGLAE